MTHALGVYYAPEHGFKVDRDYIAALQPPVIRILDPDVQHIADMHALAPNAIIAPRTWAIDDGSDEDHPSRQVRRLMAAPMGTGRDHAEQYKGQWDRWQQEAAQRGLKLPPVERILFNSANEPNQGGTPDKIAAYCVAFFDRCTELGIRACGPCLGVGWPDNNGPDTPVDWSPYTNAGLEQAIRRNGGMLSVHEYFYKSGPQDGWRWWAGRHLQCPFDVPIILGEIGIDNYVDTKRWANEGGNRGWQGNVSPEQYAEMIERHISGCDPRVKAALPFITDFRNNSWESFNTRAAHNALLARKGNMVPQGKTVTTHLPIIENGKPTAIVDAPAGANIRRGPGMDYPVLGVEVYGTEMPVMGRNGDWWQVEMEHVTGWVNGMVVKTFNVGNVPVATHPQPQGDTWPRSRAFVKRWEGGFQDADWDIGNWTGCEVGKGEKKGTKYGISACSYPQLDIRNLTIEQADEIYFRDYWQASGADKLPWPLCLVVFDTAVNFHPSTAKAWLEQSGGNISTFIALRLRGYRKSQAWPQAGNAWVDRIIELAMEASN